MLVRIPVFVAVLIIAAAACADPHGLAQADDAKPDNNKIALRLKLSKGDIRTLMHETTTFGTADGGDD